MSIDLTPVSGKGAFVRDPLRYGAVAVCEQLVLKLHNPLRDNLTGIPKLRLNIDKMV